jgi:polyisoprenoid-binding protein YceI
MTEVTADGPAPLPAGAAAGHYVLDPAGSSVTFTHKTIWGLVTVRGKFSGLSGAGDVGEDGSVSGHIDIEASSVDTGHSKRDTHLRSADFFHADAHPSITFGARSAKATGAGTLAVDGEVTAGGTTRPLALTAKIVEVTPDSATLSADAQVDRADFGMTWNQLGMLRGLAHLSVTARFNRQQ